MMKSILSLLFIGLLISSCGNAKKEAFLKQITDLEKQLEDIEKNLEANQIDTIAGVKIAASTVENRIKHHLVMDKIDLELGSKMDEFKRTRKKLNPLGSNFNKIRRGIEEEKIALLNLKTDIENGAGEKEKYAEHIDFEKNKIEQLQVLIDDFLRSRKEFYDAFNRLYPELYHLSMTLLEKDKKH